ncbi:MAG: creatininase family protein [Candidatus Eremiobacterota bacterium]
MRDWMDLTWTEASQLDPTRTVALLAVGAVEAHGPHLPLGTDGIIARAMAREAAALLERKDLTAVLLPPLDFTVAEFARNFPGTLSFRPDTVLAVLRDLTSGLRGRCAVLGVANAHLDPAHLGVLSQGLKECPLPVAFPDLTRRRLAERLTEEFRSGACHAGQYEGSVVLAERPDLVRLEVARSLPNNPSSLVTAIRQGLGSFEEAGGPQAYFGNPAGTNPEEGRVTARELGRILAEAVLELL